MASKRKVHYMGNVWSGDFGCEAVFIRATKQDFSGFTVTSNPAKVTCKNCLRDMPGYAREGGDCD